MQRGQEVQIWETEEQNPRAMVLRCGGGRRGLCRDLGAAREMDDQDPQGEEEVKKAGEDSGQERAGQETVP